MKPEFIKGLQVCCLFPLSSQELEILVRIIPHKTHKNFNSFNTAKDFKNFAEDSQDQETIRYISTQHYCMAACLDNPAG